MTDLSPHLLLDAALEIAQLASDLMLQFSEEAGVHRKSDGTLVTHLDLAVDRLVQSEILGRFPDHHILSEESHTLFDPHAHYTWIIDPLDGTTNYARGLSIWGVSLAVVSDRIPLVGVLAFLLLREVFSAVRGGGAHRNGLPIATSPITAPDDEHFIMVCTRTPRRYTLNTPLKSRSLGSAAYHVAKVADGTALAAVEATPKVWDLAAALLILEEAGGVYKPLDTQPRVFPLAAESSDYGSRALPLLVAANDDVLEDVYRSIADRSIA